MDVNVTDRGLQRIHFSDHQGRPCILEQSPALDPNNPTWDDPGSSFVLLGRQDAPVQLSLDQVADLVEHLQAWLENGRFEEAAAATNARLSA